MFALLSLQTRYRPWILLVNFQRTVFNSLISFRLEAVPSSAISCTPLGGDEVT